MPHLGLICPELSGHLNPMTTLGRELQRRGHRVTLIARPDARIKVESRGLEFSSVGDFPAGSMARTTAQLGQLGGFSAIRFRARVRRVLSEPHYRASAQRWKAEIARAEGLSQAANIVERAMESRQPVLRP